MSISPAHASVRCSCCLRKQACRLAAVDPTDQLASQVQGDVVTVLSHFTDVPGHPFVTSGLMLVAYTILQVRMASEVPGYALITDGVLSG